MRPLAFTVLRALSHERFVSGTALADSLGISRSAISDALKEASDQGVGIFKLTRRGYRLAAPIDLLGIESLREHLAEAGHRVDVEIVETIGSTNSELMRRAAAGAPAGTCIAAELQSEGRGRRGRNWKSGLGTSLTFSLLWRFDRGAAQLAGLSLAVGLAIVRALRSAGVAGAMVKWPNDILVDGKKLGGVLIETQGDMLGPTAVVIGIGINVRFPQEMAADIDQAITDIQSSLEKPVSRNKLLALVLSELVSMLDHFAAAGFPSLRDEWIACHALQNRMVRVVRDNQPTIEAIVRDLAVDGSLIVETDACRLTLSSAEISIRDFGAKAQQVAPNGLQGLRS